MSDLLRRMRDLDQIESPDLWSRIAEERTQNAAAGLGSPPGRWRQATVIAVALSVAVASTAVVIVAFTGRGSMTGDIGAGSRRPVESTGVIKGGQLRCTARFPSSVVLPGRQTGVTFTVTNLTQHSVRIQRTINSDVGSMLIRTPGGRTLVDTRDRTAGIIGASYVRPDSLPPGASTQISGLDTPIIWSGSVIASPVCIRTGLPSVRLSVAASSVAPTPADAVQRALDEIGQPIADCRPQLSPGAVSSFVVGTVHGHSGGGYSAFCGASAQPHPGFVVVVVQVVNPPPGAHLEFAYSSVARALLQDPFAKPEIPTPPPVAVSWWTFVVQQDSIAQVADWSESEHCNGSAASSGGGLTRCIPNSNR